MGWECSLGSRATSSPTNSTPSREDPLEAAGLRFKVWDTRIRCSLAATNSQEGSSSCEMKQIKDHTQVISHLQLANLSHGVRAAQLTAPDLRDSEIIGTWE